MKDKELFEQLHKLSKMKPDEGWKASQRSIMLNQINMGSEEIKPRSLFWNSSKLLLSSFTSFSQPLAITAVVAFVVLTGGFVSLKVAQGTKPGDSLYVAKIVGEKTQFALTFSEKKKAQLGLEFAVNRAEELKQVLDAEGTTEVKGDKVEKLVNDFRKELDAAKSRIAKIADEEPINKDGSEMPASTTDNKVAQEDKSTSTGKVEENDNIFTAGNDKDDKGLSISSGPSEEKKEEGKASTATGTIESKKPEEAPQIPQNILEEASALIEVEAYGEAVNVLEKASDAIKESMKEVEAQGGEKVEEATSTVEIEK